MSQKRKKFIIIDGNAILHRAFHALPPMTTKDGQMVNAVYGFLTTFFKAVKEYRPEYLAVTFDRQEKTFRHKQFKEYKAQREKQPDELYEQLPVIKEILQALNVKIYEKAGYEADDLIGTLCRERQVDNDKIISIIVTGDMDALQLVDDNTHVFAMRRGISDIVEYDEKGVQEKYNGLKPEQLIDFKGLSGDTSDNIPGVPGVGKKTAIGLLKQFGSMENLYRKVKPREYKNIKVTERIYKLLQENKKQAEQSKALATIVSDVKMDFDLKDCEVKQYDRNEVFKIFQDLEFKSLLNKLPDFSYSKNVEDNHTKKKGRESNDHDYKCIEDKKEFEGFLKKFKEQEQFVFDTETNGLNVFEAKLLGISFCWEKGKAYYVLAKPEFLKKLKPIFEDKSVKKIGHNLKFDIKTLLFQDIKVQGDLFDTMVASYLLNPGSRAHKLDDVVFRELGYEMTPITDLIGKKGKNQTSMSLVDKDKVSDYAAEDADYTWRLVKKLKKDLQKDKLWKLFQEIEMPLIPVLVEMEMNGIKINEKHLSKLQKDLEKRIKNLSQKIYKQAGEEFNIKSPKQLKEILFKKLKLSKEGLGKTKTGVSTAAGELEKLRSEHPIIELIEEYRELTKLQSTYIEALPKLIQKKTGRIHTEFNQTVTSTGRLSSSNPNLQNIPIRTELGREIRRCFVADRGNRIVAADYSQVELRVIACLADDKNMIKVFQNDQDIHKVTAAKIYEVPLEKVTKEMRYSAKEVNFGVLYGMGPWGLASRKKISRKKAKEFIDKYFVNFRKVKDYIEEMKDFAEEKGYVETIFGRRRYLPEINSGVYQVRASAERMAINHPIQGTAADLMKIAMIEVQQAIDELNKNSKSPIKMLLQVHDELVIETPKEMVDQVAKIVDEKMEKIHDLCVPIKAKTEVGMNWQDMEEVC